MKGFVAATVIMIFVARFWCPDSYTVGFMTVLGLIWYGAEIAFNAAPDAGELAVFWTGAVSLGATLGIFAVKMLSEHLDKDANIRILFFAIAGSVFVIETLEALMFSFDLTAYYSAAFSVGLIISGAVLMAVGLHLRRLVLRMASLGMFGILLIKLVAYDLWRLPMVGRIVVFILLGVVLLCLSFLYQKLKSAVFALDEKSGTDCEAEQS